ncbi:MAG TPA: gluconate:H+ symporter [Chitinophagaceae bacterium]|jgi:Gnt-I system high-affinity gluconate transporter|nr:gluconate:H+ symporter [Chitinophagaceae bacterium]
MTLIILLSCTLLLILLVAWAQIHPFLAFLLVSIAAGLLLGMPAGTMVTAIQKGLGDTIGSLLVIVVLGAMLGKLIAETGAAQKIASVLAGAFGVKYIQWALLITGFIIGSTLFYGIGFVLLVPLIFSVVFEYKLPAVYIGLPALAALSVMHGFLPPHPSPTALLIQLNADMGLTLFYGIIVAVPAIIVAGPVYSRTLKSITKVPRDIFRPRLFSPEQLPGTFSSFFAALLPVILLMTATIVSMMHIKNQTFLAVFSYVSNPTLAMFIALVSGTYMLGIKTGKSIKEIMTIYETAVKDISLVLLIIGGAGAMKQVFMEGGLDKIIAAYLQQLHMHPLVLGWLIAAIIRILLGSSTIAALMTVGFISPVLQQTHADPNLMVLSIGAGSMIFSHVNDGGFWLFKEYFNLSLRETFRSFSIMETIVAVMGLIGVMLLSLVI